MNFSKMEVDKTDIKNTVLPAYYIRFWPVSRPSISAFITDDLTLVRARKAITEAFLVY